MWTAESVVVYGQRRASGPAGRRGERDVDGATGPSGYRTAAVIGLGEVAVVRPREGDAGDAQGGGTVIGQCHGLWRARSANLLSGKSHGARRQAHRRDLNLGQEGIRVSAAVTALVGLRGRQGRRGGGPRD